MISRTCAGPYRSTLYCNNPYEASFYEKLGALGFTLYTLLAYGVRTLVVII